jgi:hypothetical protein
MELLSYIFDYFDVKELLSVISLISIEHYYFIKKNKILQTKIENFRKKKNIFERNNRFIVYSSHARDYNDYDDDDNYF